METDTKLKAPPRGPKPDLGAVWDSAVAASCAWLRDRAAGIRTADSDLRDWERAIISETLTAAADEWEARFRDSHAFPPGYWPSPEAIIHQVLVATRDGLDAGCGDAHGADDCGHGHALVRIRELLDAQQASRKDLATWMRTEPLPAACISAWTITDPLGAMVKREGVVVPLELSLSCGCTFAVGDEIQVSVKSRDLVLHCRKCGRPLLPWPAPSTTAEATQAADLKSLDGRVSTVQGTVAP